MVQLRTLVLPVLVAVLSPVAGSAQQNTPPPTVTVAPVTSQTLTQSATFTGRVEAIQHVDVLARVAGFIDSIGFDEGQSVKAGDILFEIEPDAYDAAVQQIEGQIASAEAERTLARIELDRQTDLLDRDVVAEVAVQQAQAESGKIDGQILQLQGALKNAELDLSYTKIAAPFDGRVGLTDIDVGAFVGAETGPLVSLSSIDPIYVTFPVPEAVLLDVRKRRQAEGREGMSPEAQITLANGDLYAETGTVEVVDTVVQTGTDTILLRASFANGDGLLRDGQLVTIELIADGRAASLTFPIQAMQREQAGYFVFTVAADGTAQKTPIEIARTTGTLVAVASGLSEGDMVIVDGIQKVRAGQPVQVTEAGAVGQ
ncbi:MAG: efflux RND transporter periplasmic adaptor subunit [Pseudomonadota bacterium]